MGRIVRYLGFLMLTFVMGIACLRSGLFFDEDIYRVSTFWGVACMLLVAGYGLVSSKPCLVKHKSPVFSLFTLTSIMLLIYGWHWLRGSLSTEGTGNEIIRWGLFGSVGFIAWMISREHEGAKRIRLIWHMTGLILCGSSLFTIYGLLDLPHVLFRTTDPALSATGTRLAGLVQYPNTFGAVMAAFLLERLFALPAVFRGRATPLGAAAALLPLMPYAAALLLTESRGAWIAAALACAAGLAADRRFAAPIFAAAAAPIMGAALLYRQLADVQLAPAVLPGLLWLAGLWAGCVLAGLALWRALGTAKSGAPATARPHVQPLIYIIASYIYIAAIVSVLLPLKSRFEGGTETMSARHLIYKDAWNLFLSAPWIGQGGDTWRLSYRAIQSQPYVGAEVHSGYVDIMLNTGWIGLLFALILLLVAAFRLKSSCPRLLPAFLVLLFHSIIDFDWSFGLIWLLMFWILVLGDRLDQQDIHRTANRRSWIRIVDIHRLNRSTVFHQFLVYSVLVISISCLTAWTLLAFSYGKAEHDFEQAFHTDNTKEREQLLKSALYWNPGSTKSVVQLADLLPEDEGVSRLMNSLTHSPGHPELTWAMAELQAMSRNSLQAASWYRISLLRDKHSTEKYSKAIYSLSDIARKQWSLGKRRAAMHTAFSALEVYELYRGTVELVLGTPNVRNDRDFGLMVRAAVEGEKLRNWIQESKLLLEMNALNNATLFIRLTHDITRLSIRQKHP